MLQIGDLKLEVPFFQAPLSGYSDYAMRYLARENGCPFTFAGVMLAKSAAHPKVLKKPQFIPRQDEHPIGAQILGRDPVVMAKAAKDLEQVGYDVIDINYACPAPKVLRRRRGGYLLNEPELAIEIFDAVREAVSCPLTVKLRCGYTNSSEFRDNFFLIARQLAERGADALVVHPRSVKQVYRDKADWSILGELKQECPDTVIIGSGDVFDAEQSIQKMKEAKIDGLLVARGAVGNPWIFRQLKAAFTGQPIPEKPSPKEQAETMLKHLELVVEIYGQSKAVRYFRKFTAQYSRLHPQKKQIQQELMTAKTHKELIKAIQTSYCLNW
ncbi:MAG: tRNA-dihydrouridine synthase [Phycisphaerae bacterium]|nr:tRNA-dihydrouridine synthase [Phycisphaerae bacterium]